MFSSVLLVAKHNCLFYWIIIMYDHCHYVKNNKGFKWKVVKMVLQSRTLYVVNLWNPANKCHVCVIWWDASSDLVWRDTKAISHYTLQQAAVECDISVSPRVIRNQRTIRIKKKKKMQEKHDSLSFSTSLMAFLKILWSRWYQPQLCGYLNALELWAKRN